MITEVKLPQLGETMEDGTIVSYMVNVGEMVTHRLPLSETGAGFRMVEEGRDSIKIIVEPHK